MSQSIPTGVAPMDGALFSLTLPSELRMLSVARSFVEAVCQAYRLDRATTHAKATASGELESTLHMQTVEQKTQAIIPVAARERTQEKRAPVALCPACRGLVGADRRG